MMNNVQKICNPAYKQHVSLSTYIYRKVQKYSVRKFATAFRTSVMRTHFTRRVINGDNSKR